MFAIMASDSPGRLSDYLNSDSLRVSSQVLIMCHDNTLITNVCENTHNIKFHVSKQNSTHAHNNSNIRTIAIKSIKNNLNLSS